MKDSVAVEVARKTTRPAVDVQRAHELASTLFPLVVHSVAQLDSYDDANFAVTATREGESGAFAIRFAVLEQE